MTSRYPHCLSALFLAQPPALKAMGYDAVEPWLPAYEADPAAFRRAIDDAGLGCFGFHMPLSGLADEPSRFIDIALTIGTRYMIVPFVDEADRRPTANFWKGIGETLAKGAETAAPHGLKVLWHNHAFEYVTLPDGTRPIDHILAAPDVWFEIDQPSPYDLRRKGQEQRSLNYMMGRFSSGSGSAIATLANALRSRI